MRKGMSVLVFGMLIAFWSSPAFAVLESCDPLGGAVETVDGITITYDSCFHDLNYDLDNPDITLNVEWMVDGGSCDFVDFALRSNQTNGNGPARGPKGYTPVSPFSPANGTEPEVTDSGEGFLEANFAFTALHSGMDGEERIGNAHFMLTLDCGVDGMVRLGVNVHVCDNGDTEAQCEEDS